MIRFHAIKGESWHLIPALGLALHPVWRFGDSYPEATKYSAIVLHLVFLCFCIGFRIEFIYPKTFRLWKRK